ncbi:hypothetical protein C8Q78DRAFT_400603 [Trametes maxima]|nr:hypothetical protein C8Q78DRAFT_400603 [Trametes maxima]
MSSTTSSTPSATASSGFHSIFQSAGGPPLILVVIAAGLLFGAFVAMFLLKRLRPVVVVQRVPGAGLAGETALGEKPRLFDIHLVPPEEGGAVAPWAYLSPFGAVYLQSPDTSISAPPASSRSSNPLTRIVTRLRRDPKSGKGHNIPSNDPEIRPVQLVFTVSMPNPHPTHPFQKNVDINEDDCDESPMPDCCIGTTVLPYRLEAISTPDVPRLAHELTLMTIPYFALPIVSILTTLTPLNVYNPRSLSTIIACIPRYYHLFGAAHTFTTPR